MVNKDHHDYLHYQQECDDLIKWYDEELEKAHATGCSGDAVRRVLHQRIKALQNKYSHIITFEYERQN